MLILLPIFHRLISCLALRTRRGFLLGRVFAALVGVLAGVGCKFLTFTFTHDRRFDVREVVS